jgi:hypothetical protein
MTTYKQKLAKAKLGDMILENVDVNTFNADLLSHILAESLLKRIDRDLLETKNIYLQQFDIPQITLFYMMTKAYPHVPASHDIANQYLENVVKDLKEVTLFDIGIGKGVQIQRLLRTLSKKRYTLATVNVIGLDPDEENLKASNIGFEILKAELPFNLNYYPIRKLIENFADDDYDYIRRIGGNNILINSTYALHHTHHEVNDNTLRTELFKKLLKLRPLIFTLVEPNSNHDTEELVKRFHNCWQHFGTVFDLIDTSDVDVSYKFSIKEKFFGREVRDIFGVSDYFRCERHESYDSWMLRLTRAGFKPVDFVNIKVSLPNYCEYSVSEGFVSLGYKNMTLIGVFAYQVK